MPGIAYYLSCFYRRNELLLRIGIFVNGATTAGAFGGLLAAGFTQIPEWGIQGNTIHIWRKIFFEGILTMLTGLGAMTLTPSEPSGCSFLTERQRFIAAERINQEYNETSDAGFTKCDIYRGILNINTMICGCCFMVRITDLFCRILGGSLPLTRCQFANIAVQSLSLFLPSILVALGYTSIRA